MNRIVLFTTLIFLVLIIGCDTQNNSSSTNSEKIMHDKESNSEADASVKQTDTTMGVAMGFMDAMTKGEMDKMMGLMHEDMVWQNGGDGTLPWIGVWEGKQVILEKFMPTFGANFQTLKWESEDAISGGDTAAFFGQMEGLLTKSNQKTKEFTWGLRVKVKDGKVILWNWFEDSYEVSRAYHNRK